MVTEVRGFTDPQKKQYFMKRFRHEADTIISHIKTSRSLHIMCHMPIFCWIAATVLEHVLKSRERGELPKTLTQMYIHFLVVQAKAKNVKYEEGSGTDPHWSPETRKMVESLGKLAFEQLQKGNLIFYESDLRECGLDAAAASVYSGVFTQVFREEPGLYQDKVYCFIHLSVQEFLAALHVHLTFVNSGINLLSEEQATLWTIIFSSKSEQFYQTAVDQALQSPNGHLDLFLRFLLGLSLSTNQSLLQGLLTQTGSSSQTNQKTAEYIKQKLREDVSAEKSINLFHCLNELNDRSLLKQIQKSLRSGRLSKGGLSPAQWSALAFILLSSEEVLDQFELKKFCASEEALLRLLPVVKASNKALLSSCNLSERSCEALSSVLSSQSSSLRVLDLSHNELKDSGLKMLCVGLKSPHCKLEQLRLSRCLVSEEGCAALSSVLSSQSSSLRVLDLSHNELKDSGLKMLCVGLKSPHCKLEQLRLSGCLVSEEGCAALASALRSNPSHLRELDLSYNHPGDTGVKLLSALQEDPLCSLDTLRQGAQAHTKVVLDHISILGFVVNRAKISLHPAKVMCYLGLQLDSLSTRAVSLCRETVSALPEGSSCSERGASPVPSDPITSGIDGSGPPSGSAGPTAHETPPAVVLPSQVAPSARQKEMAEAPNARKDIQFWTDPVLLSQGVRLGCVPHYTEVFTDASLSGWGGVLGQCSTGDTWSLAHQCPGDGGNRGNQISLAPQESGGDPPRGQHSPPFLEGPAHPRHSQRRRRQNVQGRSSPRQMEPSPWVAAQVWQQFDYPVTDLFASAENALCPCGSHSDQGTSLLWASTRWRTDFGRGVFFMPFLPSGSSLHCSTESGETGYNPGCGPGQSKCQVVPGLGVHGAGGTLAPPGLARHADSGPGSPLLTSNPRPQALGLEAERGRWLGLDLPSAVVSTIQGARAPSTIRAYRLRWQLFATWCAERSVDPLSCPIQEILGFLQGLLVKGRSASTLGVFASAIASGHTGFGGFSAHNHPLIKRFLRGALRLNPPSRHSTAPWDLQVVLEGLLGPPFKPLNCAELSCLSFKTALLLALASAKEGGGTMRTLHPSFLLVLQQ
ncbi:hypothetical protein WMY93_006829 [Mugilogobius chulae]|uniref:Uncharacterized protein n=1 Tax=Mugilogobius chulae TaxID=88201 RepID=A0AAW0PPE7_9GOBI